ncbi:MAG: hypothetical protein KF905_06270 [Flavobacteriales bacterium]|nr:hypothetical protein [Flavobacteriales bacterium]
MPYRILLPFLIAALAASTALAQGRVRTLQTDSGRVVLHHFTTGQISTKEWTDKDGRWGRSLAYNRSGEVIFEGQTRRVAGHASVRFSYHSNGGASKVETSDAPDGGIQWYQSTITFDADGNKTGFTEYGRDNYGPIPRLDLRITTEPEPPPQLPKQEVVVCQRMFQSELFVVNPTNAAVRVVATPKETSPGLPGGTWTMAPGDTIRIGIFSKGELWPEWKTMLELSIVQVVLGDRNKAVARIRTDERLLSEERRQLHVVIEGWATERPFEGPDVHHAPPPLVTIEEEKVKEEKPVRKRFRLRFW